MKQAFLIRCAPGRISRLDEVVNDDQIVIGWSKGKKQFLDSEINREKIKKILKTEYSPFYNDNEYSLGQATGYLWRFLKEMQVGDYVIVPKEKAFFLGEVTSSPIFVKEKLEDDTAIRRNVKWLNEKKEILREYCSSGLISRLKYQGTCVSATDLIADIEIALENSRLNKKVSFKNQLNEKLKLDISEFIKSDQAYLSNSKFEHLIKYLMIGLGANNAEIPSKKSFPNSIADVDVIADFTHLGIKIFIQVKKHKDKTDVSAVQQIIQALKETNKSGNEPIYGWVISSGYFNEKSEKLATENGIRLVNGEELAEMIISIGIEKIKEI
jgi:predicted Mrr-cat superfamily restriction endonuclease